MRELRYSYIGGLPAPAKRDGGSAGQRMFTKAVLYGMNLLTLAGFILMGVGLTLNRQGKVKAPVAFALMGAGTILVFFGLYVATPP
jgi:hypothetical protein